MQLWPGGGAARTPDQCAGLPGGFQRNGPVGGAAYGIPRNTLTPVVESMSPSRMPVSIVTRGLAVRPMAATAAMTPIDSIRRAAVRRISNLVSLMTAEGALPSTA